MSTISFSVDQETKRELESIAKTEKKSKSVIFRELFAIYKFNKELDYLQKVSRDRVLKLGLQTEDDFERYLG